MNIRAGFFAAMVLAVCMLAGSRTGAAAASATLALAPDNGASDASFSAVYSVKLGLNEKTCPQAKLTLQWDGVDIGSAVLNGCSTTFGSSTPPVGYNKPGTYQVCATDANKLAPTACTGYIITEPSSPTPTPTPAPAPAATATQAAPPTPTLAPPPPATAIPNPAPTNVPPPTGAPPIAGDGSAPTATPANGPITAGGGCAATSPPCVSSPPQCEPTSPPSSPPCASSPPPCAPTSPPSSPPCASSPPCVPTSPPSSPPCVPSPPPCVPTSPPSSPPCGTSAPAPASPSGRSPWWYATPIAVVLLAVGGGAGWWRWKRP